MHGPEPGRRDNGITLPQRKQNLVPGDEVVGAGGLKRGDQRAQHRLVVGIIERSIVGLGRFPPAGVGDAAEQDIGDCGPMGSDPMGPSPTSDATAAMRMCPARRLGCLEAST